MLPPLKNITEGILNQVYKKKKKELEHQIKAVTQSTRNQSQLSRDGVEVKTSIMWAGTAVAEPVNS